MKKDLEVVPEFISNAEGRTFWESSGNDSTEYVDWNKARTMTLPNLHGRAQAFRTSTSVE